VASGVPLSLKTHKQKEDKMPDSVYKVIELVGSSPDSWEKAAAAALKVTAKSLKDLRIAEVSQLDLQLDEKGKVRAYRTKLKVSFRYHAGS
jgi:flavin-binding protein dodecin